MFKIFYYSMFFFVFEFCNFNRKHSNLMFYYVVDFRKKKFVNSFFCFSRTLLCFKILLFFVQLKNSFFDIFEEFFSSIINVKK